MFRSERKEATGCCGKLNYEELHNLYASGDVCVSVGWDESKGKYNRERSNFLSCDHSHSSVPTAVWHHTKFQTPNSNGSLIIAIKPNAHWASVFSVAAR
jgi:aspartyl aminopeptidase